MAAVGFPVPDVCQALEGEAAVLSHWKHFKNYCVKEQSRERSDKEGISKNLLSQASTELTASEVELLLGEKPTAL